MKAHEIESAIGEALSMEAREWWDGACREYRDDLVSLGRREGIEKAVEAVEELARPEADAAD